STSTLRHEQSRHPPIPLSSLHLGPPPLSSPVHLFSLHRTLLCSPALSPLFFTLLSFPLISSSLLSIAFPTITPVIHTLVCYSFSRSVCLSLCISHGLSVCLILLC